MNCIFCNNLLQFDQCSNHKVNFAQYNLNINYFIGDYCLMAHSNFTGIYHYTSRKYVFTINQTIEINPESAEAILQKLLKLKSFS